MRIRALLLAVASVGCVSSEEYWNWRLEPPAKPAVHPEAYRWAPAAPDSVSRWTKDVDPSNPRPELPALPGYRPDPGQSLNGLWQFREARAGDAPPIGVELDELVLVPFTPASSLSGLGRAVEGAWYRRTFTIPESWGSQRVLLHFGAVSREARVWVDGVLVGEHSGAWDAFQFDVTEPLLARGVLREHEIVVSVNGPATTIEPGQPTAGIWQSVRLASVPRVHVTSVDVMPHPESATLDVRVHVTGTDEPVGVRVRVDSFEASLHCRSSGKSGQWIALDPEYSRRWGRDDAFAYMVVIALDGVAGADRVLVWTCIPDAEPRAWLRGGERMGFVDAGAWPDGLATAPTFEALVHGGSYTGIGLDFVRKRAKIEERSWYGVTESGQRILQDLPPPIEDTAQYEIELRRIVAQLRDHPRLAAWVVPESGLGTNDRARALAIVRELDPLRPILDANGWVDVETGEMFRLRVEPAPSAGP